jgi:protein-L-isoaspartate(D-aspartate) O-methyltransferase
MASKRIENEARLSAVRRSYTKQVMIASGVDDSRIEAALAKLPRERFLGAGPWPLMRQASDYEMTPDDDPVHLYQDVLVGLNHQKGLNNGQPSFVASLLSLGRLREGESAVHIGAGQGYYTAIIAELVGITGSVTAVEFEKKLADRATANLSTYSQVRVVHGDGTTVQLEPSDVIYVNAGAVCPIAAWLDTMKDGGRLILPLTSSPKTKEGNVITRGAIFLIERSGDDFEAHWKSETAIYPCFGARDEEADAKLAAAFQGGGWEKVTRLYRTEKIADERCWLRGPGWALAYS